jgi:hypothetical protein
MKFFLFFIFFANVLTAQDRSGYTWPTTQLGFVSFDAITNQPFSDRIRDIDTITYQNNFFIRHSSSISDSATGNLIMYSDGEIAYNKYARILKNGTYLTDSIYFNQYGIFPAGENQCAVVLPKGNKGQYYIFNAYLSDSAMLANYNYCTELSYSIADMKANNDSGEIVIKKQKLITNKRLSYNHMAAVRHANGVDWWLFKLGYADSMLMYTFLVKADTILGPFVQQLPLPTLHKGFANGQMSFSNDGNALALTLTSAGGLTTEVCDSPLLYRMTVNRGTGIVSDYAMWKLPRMFGDAVVDSLVNPCGDYKTDVISTGVCFSPNDSLIYYSTEFNIYQVNFLDAIQPIKHFQGWRFTSNYDNAYFCYWGNMQQGPDGKIYVGNIAGGNYIFGTISNPNSLNNAVFEDSGFISKYPIWNYPNWWLTLISPSNNPNYNLTTHAPIAIDEVVLKKKFVIVYPNPTNGTISIQNDSDTEVKMNIYSALGKLITSYSLPPMSSITRQLAAPNGIYFYQCTIGDEIMNGKIIKE